MPARRTFTPDMLKQAQELLDAGMSQRQVAARLGVSQAGLSEARSKNPSSPLTTAGDGAGDPIADKIFAALRTEKRLTRTYIRNLVGHNLPAAQIDSALQLLEEWGRIRVEKEQTAGAPINWIILENDLPLGGADLSVADLNDVPDLLRERGLNPDDWVIVRARVNEWGDQKQLRVDVEPRAIGGLLPARTDGWRPPTRVPLTTKDEAELVVFFGDQHCPHHDLDLHAAACEWLRKNKPTRGILIGDLLDFDAVSRHRHNPEWATTMQDAVDTAYQVLRAYIQASPQTRWQLLSGNHEDRLRNAIIDHLKGVYGLTRAAGATEDRGEAVLSVQHLLRLDELEVEWVGAKGEYTHGQIKVCDNLAARHGWIAKKGSGASAIATLDALRYSVVIGHTHRQSMVFHTAHDIDGVPAELVGVEAGTMARVSGGLGYTPVPDWQQGFATARIWPDGLFSCDLAKFVDGTLMWANQRYAGQMEPGATA